MGVPHISVPASPSRGQCATLENTDLINIGSHCECWQGSRDPYSAPLTSLVGVFLPLFSSAKQSETVPESQPSFLLDLINGIKKDKSESPTCQGYVGGLSGRG